MRSRYVFSWWSERVRDLRDGLLHGLRWTGYLLVVHLLFGRKVYIIVLYFVDKQRVLRLCGRNLFTWRSDDLHWLRSRPQLCRRFQLYLLRAGQILRTDRHHHV